MKSTPKILSMLLSTALTIATFTSCGGDEPAGPSTQPDTPAATDIETLIADNIKVYSSFDNPMWTFTVTSTLEGKLPSCEIDYYLELSIDDREATFGTYSLEKNKHQSYIETTDNDVKTITISSPFYYIHSALTQINLTEITICNNDYDTLLSLGQQEQSTWTEDEKARYDMARAYLSQTASDLRLMTATILLYTNNKFYTLAQYTLSDFLPE